MAPRAPLLDRLATKFTVADGCWEWFGAVNSSGYGVIKSPDGSTMLYAHRALYEALNGPIPEGLELDHLCRHQLCVRPDHLEAVTHAENVKRGDAGKHQAEKTHCPRGHAFDEANTYWRPDRKNRRECRACRAAALITSRRKKGESLGLVC